MAYDFTTFTETDPNSRITVTSSTITATSLTLNETAHVQKDMGVDYFSGDFSFDLDVTPNGQSADATPAAMCFAVANAVNDYNSIKNASGSLIAVALGRASGSLRLQLFELDSGTQYGATALTGLSSGTTYYCRVTRDESVGDYGSAYLYVYSDTGRTTLLSTQEIALHTSKKDYRYLYGAQSRHISTAYTISFTLANLADAPIVKTVADTATGTDDISVFIEKTVADTATGVDAVSAFIIPTEKTVADTATGTDGVSVPFRIIAVADAGSGVDGIILDNGNVLVSVADTATGVDGVSVSLRIINISDTATGTDGVGIQAILMVADTATGVDAVSALSQNSLMFGVTGFPSGQAVEYRIVDLHGTVVQNWTSTGVVEDGEITGRSTYTIKNIQLANGFQGKVSWRIPSTSYYAVEILNYYESWIATYASLPTLPDIEASSVLAKEATSTAIKTKTDNLPADPASEGSVAAIQVDIDFLLACVRNKKEVKKIGSAWYLIIYDALSNEILRKELKDKDGNAITDLAAGTLAQELASSV